MNKEHICRDFKLINNYIEKQLNENLAKYNLTRSQIDILVFLKKSEKNEKEVNQKDIEKNLSLRNPTITGLLDRLEIKGYIKREVSSIDKRYRKIVLTQSSYEILDDGKEQIKSIEKKLLKTLDKEEIENLNSILNKIIIKIKEEIC